MATRKTVKTDAKVIVTRVICIIIAGLMVLGILVAAILSATAVGETSPLITDGAVDTSIQTDLTTDGSASAETGSTAITDASSTETSSTDITSTEPPSTGGTTTAPPSTEPLTTNTDTPNTEPVTTDPSATDPVTTDPSATEPVTTDPPATEPVTTEPVTTEPVTTEEPPTTEEPEIPDEEMVLFKPDDYLIRCGIFFRTDTLPSYQMRTTNGAVGFELFTTTESNVLHHIWTLENNNVSVCRDGNLKKTVTDSSTSKWYYQPSTSAIVAGGYHLQLEYSFISQTRTLEYMERLAPAAENIGLTLFPAYIDGSFRIRTGAYTSSNSAKADLEAAEKAFGCTVSVVSPTPTSLVIIDYNTAKVLFSFDMPSTYGLGLYAIENGVKQDYVKVQKGYYFKGVMEFRRYTSSDVDGITMILISELEDYVASVVPWEIYTSWPVETIKTFCVCARTFVISNSHESAKHGDFGVDVCDNSCCQVCLGFSRVNQSITKAVTETAGEIVTCDGEPILLYYTDLGGGSMAGANEVWNMGREYKYLVGQMTPWEDLTATKYGSWYFTASPTELLATVRSAGYTTLKGAIDSVRINKLCENSTYVYSVTITDTYGTSVTVTRCRNVKAVFSGYMYAANFVIEHNGMIDDGINGAVFPSVSGLSVMTGNGLKVIVNETEINVMTGTGIRKVTLPKRLITKTSLSMVTCDVMAETAEFIKNTGAVTSSDFIFRGSGNGHGVGASQWGCKDLGELGYSYDRILSTYFPHTSVMKYTDYINK